MKVLAFCGKSGPGRLGVGLSDVLPCGGLVWVGKSAYHGDHAGSDRAGMVISASDDPVHTVIATPDGEIGGQDFRVDPASRVVSRVRYDGARRAAPSPALLAALDDPALTAIIICPCDPVLDIDPILAISGMRDALRRSMAPVIAVSPIIAGAGGDAATAPLLSALGIGTTASAICDHYEDFIDAMVFDEQDEGEAGKVEVPVAITKIGMPDDAAGRALANFVLDLAGRIAIVR